MVELSRNIDDLCDDDKPVTVDCHLPHTRSAWNALVIVWLTEKQ